MKNLKKNEVRSVTGFVELATFVEEGKVKNRLYFHYNAPVENYKRAVLFQTLEYFGEWNDNHDASINYYCLEVPSSLLSAEALQKAFQEITGVECDIIPAPSDHIDVYVSGGIVQEIYTTNLNIQITIWDADNDMDEEVEVDSYQRMKNQNHFKDGVSRQVI